MQNSRANLKILKQSKAKTAPKVLSDIDRMLPKTKAASKEMRGASRR